MAVSAARKKALKARAHALKPVVRIGDKGLSTAVMEELAQALACHELIKVKVAGADKMLRDNMAQAMCRELQAELIQSIGGVLVLYRHNPRKKLKKGAGERRK